MALVPLIDYDGELRAPARRAVIVDFNAETRASKDGFGVGATGLDRRQGVGRGYRRGRGLELHPSHPEIVPRAGLAELVKLNRVRARSEGVARAATAAAAATVAAGRVGARDAVVVVVVVAAIVVVVGVAVADVTSSGRTGNGVDVGRRSGCRRRRTTTAAAAAAAAAATVATASGTIGLALAVARAAARVEAMARS
jgi:hypothetical protein